MDLKLDFRPIEAWKTDIPRDSPEIVCISRPFIEQVLYRNQYGRAEDKDWMSSFSHSNHHHAHYAPEIEPDILNGKSDLVERNAVFQLRPQIRYRGENGGSVLAQRHNVYFVNDRGLGLVRNFSRPFRYEDLGRLSNELNIPQQESRDFFKKLLVFDLLEWTL